VIRPALFVVLATALLFASANLPTAPAAPADPPKKDDKGGIDRTGATKKRLLKEFGGSEESEEAVMLGLAWLTQMQKPGGNWEYDTNSSHKSDHAAATGMAVLAFLGAGQSHQAGRYKQTVQAGLDWLVKNVDMKQGPNFGKIYNDPTMYSQGIATLALCEAYGMTQDPKLKEAAQAAIDYIQRAQGQNGSWGYTAKTQGDTSIVGWQIQALHAAKLARLNVDDNVIRKAIGFLDYVSTGRTKAVYGYTNPGGSAATSLTAIGLLCRYYISDWRAETPGFAEGTKGLMTRAPSATPRKQLDLYYYYYATQVVRYHGGEEWKTWNEGVMRPDGDKNGMADWLIALQIRTPRNRGSWDPEMGTIGGNCGRLGTTCLCLLTLEVYYRYDPTANQQGAKKP